MSDEPRGALEGLASALVSSDLTVKKEGKRGDVDYLIALGAVGIRLRPGASAMINVALSHDKASLTEALWFSVSITRHLNQKRGWRLKMKDLKFVAERALRYHIAPACPACEGRKYKRVDGSPSLSASPCPTCHGTGRRPYPIRYGREIAEVVYSLEDTNRVIEHLVRNRLR